MGQELSEGDFWRAVAAIGCVDAEYPFGQDLQKLVDSSGKTHLSWVWNTDKNALQPLLQRIPPPPDWVDLWRRIRRPLVMRTCFDNQEEVVRALSQYRGTQGRFISQVIVPWVSMLVPYLSLASPSVRIRLCRFVRSMPSARAAPETFQFVSSSARKM